MKHNGFTFIEFMIVAAIIGILIAIAVPAYMNSKCEGSYTAECKEFRSKKNSVKQTQVQLTQCSNGLLFDRNGKQIIGTDGNGVSCR